MNFSKNTTVNKPIVFLFLKLGIGTFIITCPAVRSKVRQGLRLAPLGAPLSHAFRCHQGYRLIVRNIIHRVEQPIPR